MLAAKARMWEAGPWDTGTQLFCLTSRSLPIDSRATSYRQSYKSCRPAAAKLRKPPLNLEIQSWAVPPIAPCPIHYAWICGICVFLAQLIKIMSWMIKALLWSANFFLCLEAAASNTSRTSANEPEMSLPFAVLSRARWTRTSNPQASLCSSTPDSFSFALTTVSVLRCRKTSCLQPGLSAREPFVPGFHQLSSVQSWLKTPFTVIGNISVQQILENHLN